MMTMKIDGNDNDNDNDNGNDNDNDNDNVLIHCRVSANMDNFDQIPQYSPKTTISCDGFNCNA